MEDVVVAKKSQGVDSDKQNKKPSHKKRKRLPKLFYILIIIILLAIAGFFFYKYYDLKQNPDKIINQEVTQITEEISRFMTLPDETPTLATVEDKSKLDSQPFFEDAENGDKILIYTEAKKAIIYRQSEKKIINVGPIAIDSSDTE